MIEHNKLLLVENFRLRKALRNLSSEAMGVAQLNEPGLRQLIGNTNYNLLLLRAAEARDLLAIGDTQ